MGSVGGAQFLHAGWGTPLPSPHFEGASWWGDGWGLPFPTPSHGLHTGSLGEVPRMATPPVPLGLRRGQVAGNSPPPLPLLNLGVSSPCQPQGAGGGRGACHQEVCVGGHHVSPGMTGGLCVCVCVFGEAGSLRQETGSVQRWGALPPVTPNYFTSWSSKGLQDRGAPGKRRGGRPSPFRERW